MAQFASTQAQLVLAARAQGYFTSNDKSERAFLCPQCKVKQGILFHKESKPDIMACPCGKRIIMKEVPEGEEMDAVDLVSKRLRDTKRESEARVQKAHREGTTIVYGGQLRYDC